MSNVDSTPARHLSSWRLPSVDESPNDEGGSFSFGRSDLVLYWHRLRAVFLVLVIAGGLVLALTWLTAPGHDLFCLVTQNAALHMAGVATILLVDAIRRVRRRNTKVLATSIADATMVASGMLLIQVPFHAAPFLYVALTAAILLPVRRAVWIWGYSGLLAVLVATGTMAGPWTVHTPTATQLVFAEWFITILFSILCLTEVLLLTGALRRFDEARHARLAYQVRRKDEFLAGVSHTLRTPLASIVGYGQIIDEEWGHLIPDEAGEFLAILNQQADTMSAMVDNLLVRAQDDIGELTLTMQQVDIRRVTADVIGRLAWLNPHKTIRLTGDLQCEGWADPVRTRQIIYNLVSNAIEHGGDSIVVNLAAGAAEMTLTVTDDGSRPAQYDGELPLRPLEKCNPTVSTPTMGFGIPVSLRLAQLHGGDLTHHHTPGMVTFSLTLPSGQSVPEDDKHLRLVVA